MLIWKERIYLKLKVYNSPNLHILNTDLLEFYCLCSRQKIWMYPGICGIDRTNSAWQMEKIPCSTWMGNTRSVWPAAVCTVALWYRSTNHEESQLPKACGIHQVAEDKTRLCCALGEQSEASICYHSLSATKIALGTDSTSGKEGGMEGDHLASD